MKEVDRISSITQYILTAALQTAESRMTITLNQQRLNILTFMKAGLTAGLLDWSALVIALCT